MDNTDHKIDIADEIQNNKLKSSTNELNGVLVHTNIKGKKLDKINENSPDTRKNRSKFQTIEEYDTINNTTADINTESLSSDEPYDDNTIKNKPDNFEFSLSTLDRKLKEIHKIKKNRLTSVSGISGDSPETHKLSMTHHQDTTSYNHVNNATIMLNPSKLINNHINEIQLRIIGHTRSAIMYERKEKILGYPVTILSSFLASSIMMSITSDNIANENIIKYISLSLSITSFLFSISRDYLNYARKFQSHDLSSKLYTTLLRTIELRLINNHVNTEEKRVLFKDIIDQMSLIEQYEIPIPSTIETNIRNNHALII